MNTNKYGLEVLINGTSGKKNIAKLSHNGKLFIEAKDGTEYLLRVSNNTGKRVMAVISVDGVNVVDGTKGSEQGTGYIVNAFSSIEVKGFRESSTHVGNFKFTTKGKSYSGEAIGETTNSGVIGCIFVDEKEDPQKKLLDELAKKLAEKKVEEHHHHHHHNHWDWQNPWWGSNIIYGSGSTGGNGDGTYTSNGDGTYTSNGGKSYSADNIRRSVSASDNVQSYYQSTNMGTTSSPSGQTSAQSSGDILRGTERKLSIINPTPQNCCNFMEADCEKAPEFDLGTTWGQRVYDKVEFVEFERGVILEQFAIYYASREILVEAGVPVVQKKSVSFPNAFPNQFCKPPRSY